MYQSILDVLDVIFSTGRTQVPILIEVSLDVAIHCCRQREKSDVKFTIFVEQGLLTVLLDDVAAFLAVDHVVLDDGSDLG